MSALLDSVNKSINKLFFRLEKNSMLKNITLSDRNEKSRKSRYCKHFVYASYLSFHIGMVALHVINLKQTKQRE